MLELISATRLRQKRISTLLFGVLVSLLLSSASANEKRASVTLGAAPFETYVSNDGEPARLNAIVSEAFDSTELDIQLHVMRDAFLGSALLTGKIDGEFAYVDLGENNSQFILSDIYLPLYLYAVSKRDNVNYITLFPHLKDNRVAIENRFANTPELRMLKEVKWSRNPSTFDAFRQLADERAPYLITSQLLAQEFNTLLTDTKGARIYFSQKPLVVSGFRLAINKNVSHANRIIDAFNAAINTMQNDGRFNKLLARPWLTKDVDGDGIADFIGSASTTHRRHTTHNAYSLDGKPTATDSRYFIDNRPYTSLSDAQKVLPDENEIPANTSLLDATTYQKLIRSW